MGAAVSAMHYTGMASASFMPSTVAPGLSHAASVSSLGNAGIVIVTLIVLVTVVLTSAVDRRLASQRAELERGRELATINEELRKEMLERQRAEDALRRSEDQLRLVIDTIPALVWSASPDVPWISSTNAGWNIQASLRSGDWVGLGRKSFIPKPVKGS